MSSYNKQRDIVVGLQIFMAHGGNMVDAQHDILYAAQKTGEALTPKETATLLSHGWFHPSDGDCDCRLCYAEDGEENRSAYSAPDEDGEHHLLACTNWAIFT